MKIPTASWSPAKPSPVVDAFLDRSAVSSNATDVAAAILADIRREGDKAVVRHARRLDTPNLTAARLRVSEAEIAAASAIVDRSFRRSVKEAARRIDRFSRAGLRKDWRMTTPRGGFLGEQFRPLDRVGVYIPGGTAPLVSTALMTACLARAAGVPSIVACTPAVKDGSVNPFVLHAMQAAGVTEIYRIGGVMAVGALAYGTRTIARVQKIVGPGNAYVTAAKKLVYGQVALDSIAGPSEVAILADDSADPRHVAADLLAQAEHGTGEEKALLVTTSVKLARAVERELHTQRVALPRSALIDRVLDKGLLFVTVKKLDDGITVINRFAPEHLEILVRNPAALLPRLHAAGAIFLGPWTPESAGDFVAGPSHVLPTGGAAAMFSGLTVDDFRRRSSVISLTRADLAEMLPVIEDFGRVEGLEGHARSARIRFLT
ncbi:MAG: histidinol dehydrogenase [Kiritimatiellia bacterium]